MLSTDNGFQEATAIVSDAADSAARLCHALGFVERWRGAAEDHALRLLGLPAGDRASEVVIGHPDTTRGDIRLISRAAPPAPLARDGARAWDSGGIFDINVRALRGGIESVHEALGRARFLAHAPVTEWDFGSMAVREVVESDPDGLAIAVMERVTPPLTGYDGIGGPVSWVFNSTQVVPDFDAARRVYVDGLGWRVVQETNGFAAQESGENCMGLPIGIAATIPMRIGIYQAQGRMEGSVEIIAFGCQGRDFSSSAPPQRGWASLRFAVTDLGSLAAGLHAGGCRLAGPVEFDWHPHGRVRAIAGITPWGARLEGLQRV